MKKFIIGLLLTILSIAALMLIPSKQAPAPMPWEITVMPDGNIRVFNLHLGTSTYRDAQQAFNIYGKVAAFTQEGTKPTIEAFYDSINVGGLSGKLVLNLAVPEQQIYDMTSRALEARIQPSGAHRFELSNDDKAILINQAIIAMTYIPSIKLTSDMVRHRFGEPAAIDNNDGELWHYPELGLTIRLKEGEKSILQYQLISPLE